MPEQPKFTLIRHIAVALDCSPHSIASLTIAAELAHSMHAELTGIFVEDINLLRMAELPFCHEIRIYTSEPEHIDASQFERSLKLQARSAEESLQRIAGEFMIKHSFRVYRGVVPAEVISASIEADLLVLGRSGRSPTCRKGLGSTARKALAEGKKPLLLIRPGFSAKEWPLLVLYDGSKGSKQALEAALDLTHPGMTLNVLILGETRVESEEMEHQLSETITLPGSIIEYHHLPLKDGKPLMRYIRMADSGLLVLSDRMKISRQAVHELINEIDYPVLLV
ncbi:MAG: universal stress protein [Chlorobiaceae bacterium]|nr:universal stress protein [Chlorobiaceae bacterium]